MMSELNTSKAHGECDILHSCISTTTTSYLVYRSLYIQDKNCRDLGIWVVMNVPVSKCQALIALAGEGLPPGVL